MKKQIVLVACALTCIAAYAENRVEKPKKENVTKTDKITLSSRKWKKIDARHFMFIIPHDMQNAKIQGMDSLVKKYTSDKIILSFDYGWYSSSLNEFKKYPNFTQKEIKIDKKKAILVTLTNDKDNKYPFIVAIHCYDVGKPKSRFQKTKLTMIVRCKDKSLIDKAIKIVKSIRFSKDK